LSTSGADPEHIERIRRGVLDAGVEAGVRLIDDRLIDIFAAAGEPDHVAARLREYQRAGLRGILAWHVLGPDRMTGLRLFADEVRPRVV